MSKVDIVRAWKDAEYRCSLSAEELAHLPEHPAGAIELADEDLREAVGGTTDTAECLMTHTQPCTVDFFYCQPITLTQP